MRSILTQTLAYATGIDKRFAKTAALNFNDTSYKPTALKQSMLDCVSKVKAAQAARAQWILAAADARKAVAELRPVLKAFKAFLLALYGRNATALHDFGLTPPRQTKAKVAVKAEAQAKSKATRDARHTMGRKARKAIKVTTTVKA